MCPECEGHGNTPDPMPHHECVPCPICNQAGFERYFGFKPTARSLADYGWSPHVVECFLTDQGRSTLNVLIVTGQWMSLEEVVEARFRVTFKAEPVYDPWGRSKVMPRGGWGTQTVLNYLKKVGMVESRRFKQVTLYKAKLVKHAAPDPEWKF